MGQAKAGATVAMVASEGNCRRIRINANPREQTRPHCAHVQVRWLKPCPSSPTSGMVRTRSGSSGDGSLLRRLVDAIAQADGDPRVLRSNIAPALFLQFHQPHHPGLDDRGLGDKRNVLLLRLLHVLLRVAARLE